MVANMCGGVPGAEAGRDNSDAEGDNAGVDKEDDGRYLHGG